MLTKKFKFIKGVQRHSPESSSTRSAHEFNVQHMFGDYTYNLQPHLPGDNKSMDEIYGSQQMSGQTYPSSADQVISDEVEVW